MDLYQSVIPLLLVAALAVTASPSMKPPIYPDQRVVYDFSGASSGKWAIALENIHNHIDIVGRTRIHLFVVVHGSGVWILRRARTNPAFNKRLLALLAEGVHLRISEDALKERGLNRHDVADVGPRTLVKSGAAEIVRLEQRGYLYIKP